MTSTSDRSYKVGLRFRLEPTPAQAAVCVRFAGARRFVWNWGLAQRKTHYAASKTTLSLSVLDKALTQLKRQPDTAWLTHIDSQLLQQALRDLEQAFRRFFDGTARFPRFKSKKRDRLTFRIPQRIKVHEGKVSLPKIGWVRFRQSRAIEGRLTSATVSQDACGHWWVTLTTEQPIVATPPQPPNPDCIPGIDDGVADLVVLTTGGKIPAPRFLRQGERRLRRAHQALSRTQRGSHNRDKARQRLARCSQRIANQRRDFLHQLSHRLLVEFDGLCIQDHDLRSLARTKLAKSLLDASLGELRRQFRYKARWRGKVCLEIEPRYPSTQVCSACLAQNTALTLQHRTWTCPTCGANHDRDLNAAQNIRREGLHHYVAVGHTETRNACRESVSLRHRRSKAP